MKRFGGVTVCPAASRGTSDSRNGIASTAPPAPFRNSRRWSFFMMGPLGGFPNPPAKVSDEQSSSSSTRVSWRAHLVLPEAGAGRDAAESGGQRAARREPAAHRLVRARVAAVGRRVAPERVAEVVRRQARLDLAALGDPL